ncbi:MAG: hypothetical protein U9Q62_01175 [Campylobacterota bacterium]|nr:hypothetical protein [Campylobacterota bacterium]
MPSDNPHEKAIDSHNSEIENFKEQLSGHDEEAMRKAKDELRRRIFESDDTPQDTTTQTTSTNEKPDNHHNEIDDKIEQFLKEKEEAEAQLLAEEKRRKEELRRSQLADPKNFKNVTARQMKAKAQKEILNDPNRLDAQVEAETDEEKQAKINENIDMHLQVQEEMEAKRKAKVERLKAEARQEEQALSRMGNFSNTRKRHHNEAAFSSFNDDITKSSFLKQQIVISDYIFLPEGFEAILLGIYFLIFPYVTGLIFLFFFVANRDISSFLVFEIFAVIPVWAIGYEVLAGIILLLITKSALSFYFKKRKAMKKAEKAMRNKVRRMEKSRTKFG